MTNTCPKCGGSMLRQITPGYFECSSPVTIGVVQRPGNLGPMPATEPCRHRFQTGITSAAEPCGCGRDSIGSCVDCGRRLCGLHGTTKGDFICAECYHARQRSEAEQARVAAEQARAAAAQAEEDRASRRGALTARLAATRDPHEIAALITGNEADLTDAAAKDAWVRLVSSGTIPPTHDIVTVAGKEHLLVVGNFSSAADPGRRWRETGRADAWRTRNGMGDHWLDASGRLWLPDQASGAGSLRAGWRWQNHVALPRGKSFSVTSSPGSFGLIHYAGSVNPRSAVGGIVLSESVTEAGHAGAVASILRAS